ncbi:MAG: hypothetical protein JKY13_00820, partial [Gammaproteobacteria bacterium]|nr:hypothetical protein [Gammaproteobacteria bacterium]
MNQKLIPKKRIDYYNWRYRTLLIILSGVLLGLTVRMLYLMVFERGFLQQQGDARMIRTINIPAYRGMITDRNGNPLAISSPVSAIWVNPKKFIITRKKLQQLSQLLSIPSTHIIKHIKHHRRLAFLYLKRQIPPFISQQIKALKISGVHLQREYKRYYPEGAATAHVVGITNIDDRGQEGLELAYNHWLQGISGKEKVVKDRLGHIISVLDILHEPKPGKNLTLSIDRRIQYLAYRNLVKTIKKFNASAGSVVVLNIKTGEILAMASCALEIQSLGPIMSDVEMAHQ